MIFNNLSAFYYITSIKKKKQINFNNSLGYLSLLNFHRKVYKFNYLFCSFHTKNKEQNNIKTF